MTTKHTDERREENKLKMAFDLAYNMRNDYTAFHTREGRAIMLICEVLDRRKEIVYEK